jgi:Domain of unknown function (DUF4386)
MKTLKQQARRAGLIYLVMGLIAPIGLMYVPGELVVFEDAAATADNLRNSEWLLRLGIASELTHQAILVFLALALYRLFKPVNETLARQLLILGALVSVPIMFVNVLNDLAALTLAKGADFLAPFERPELDALAYLFVRLHSLGITVASIFWGLWLVPFGLLVIRSGFIPRFLGYLLFVAGGAYLAAAIARLVLPQYEAVVSSIALPLYIAELPIIFWLAIWGARTPRGAAVPA